MDGTGEGDVLTHPGVVGGHGAVNAPDRPTVLRPTKRRVEPGGTPIEPADATRARLEVGDSLRALAALGVVLLHVLVITTVETGQYARLQAEPIKYFAALFGAVGYAFNGLLVSVDLFFVLSGYLLTRPFLRAFIADDRLPAIPGYVRNRALRVLPTFWFVLLVVVVVNGRNGDSWRDVFALAGFVNDFRTSGIGNVYSQPWSLSVEIRFYLFLPLAGLALFALRRWLGGRLPRWSRVVLVALLVAVGFHASQVFAQHNLLSASLASHAQFFAPGVLLALIEHVVPDRARGRRWLGPIAVAIFILGIALTLGWFYLSARYPGPHAYYYVPVGTGAIVAGPLLWQWSGRRSWRALDNRVLRWVGRRSYPLFLIHDLVLVKLAPHLVVGGFATTFAVVGAVGFGVSMLAADLIHRVVERPALRLKHVSGSGRHAHHVVREDGASDRLQPVGDEGRRPLDAVPLADSLPGPLAAR